MNELEVLISAMYQKDLSLIENTGINTPVLIINQCDKNDIYECGNIRCISTTERGLSKSRNMALRESNGKICLICDDDERLSPDYGNLIIDSFNLYKDADVLCFKVKTDKKKYPNRVKNIGYIRSLRISSWQIAFRLDSIKKHNIKFDERFGSGTPLGSGEENIFLYDCLKSGLIIKYLPIEIGSVFQEVSQWFKGFDEIYFLNRGTIIRRLMGTYFGLLYCIYFIFTKYRLYKKEISFSKALKSIINGYKREM